MSDTTVKIEPDRKRLNLNLVKDLTFQLRMLDLIRGQRRDRSTHSPTSNLKLPGISTDSCSMFRRIQLFSLGNRRSCK